MHRVIWVNLDSREHVVRMDSMALMAFLALLGYPDPRVSPVILEWSGPRAGVGRAAARAQWARPEAKVRKASVVWMDFPVPKVLPA